MTIAADLMMRFVERTGVAGQAHSRRYLWTDAFAVCNLLGLGHRELARALIERVHRVLGRHRDDAAHRGWISGLSETEGAAHPTIGGLRIGKPLAERSLREPLDDRLEWDRDGQYFHYLTKWMHALACASRVLDDPRLATWARELAETAHRRFVHDDRGHRRMYWKMSIDLSRPLVASMGHHDPLDGYVTGLEVGVEPAITRDYRSMIEPGALATTDALGIGGLLVDAHRLTQLDRDRDLASAAIAAARLGLAHYVERGELAAPVARRLAFRELGLAIGLAAFERLGTTGASRLREEIIACWLDPANRRSATYREHEDINDVMLATALAPEGFLELR